MSANLAAGLAAAKILRNLTNLPDNHYAIHRRVAEELGEAGFDVRKFVDVKYWGGKYNGRIDVVAERDGGTVAIELNNRHLKPRSGPKLRNMDAYRIIASRGVEFTTMPEGVDENVRLHVDVRVTCDPRR